MRSCERCFCAAGFAQTWPPWSMRVSEKSSSNEKAGAAMHGQHLAKHESRLEHRLSSVHPAMMTMSTHGSKTRDSTCGKWQVTSDELHVVSDKGQVAIDK